MLGLANVESLVGLEAGTAHLSVLHAVQDNLVSGISNL